MRTMRFGRSLVLLLALLLGSAQSAELRVWKKSNEQLWLRWSWDERQDLLLHCGPGGNNRQFNYSSAYLIDRGLADADCFSSPALEHRIHWCGDSTGVMHMYPDADSNAIYILSGNHGYNYSIATVPQHGFTSADVGKSLLPGHYLLKVPDADTLWIVPPLKASADARITAVQPGYNYRATRILQREYFLDGQPVADDTAASGHCFQVVEKTGIATFPALLAAKFEAEAVEDFYAVYDITYSFYDSRCCRVDTQVTFPKDILLMGVGPMQDSALDITRYDFYERYIPKVRPIQEPETTPQSYAPGSAIYYRKDGKYLTDTRRYDFAAVQDMTPLRLLADRAEMPRFEIRVASPYVDPLNQPDRFIEFIGKNEGQKRVRKVGSVLGMDPETGICRPYERQLNRNSVILSNVHKTYPTHLGRGGKTLLTAGTVLHAVGYRGYFNPETIGAATALYTVPFPDHIRVYADFHQKVQDYELPLPLGTVTVVEKSDGLILAGKRVSLSGDYGYIVVKVTPAQD
ncbi:MAG: hypothetical protein GX564_07080 [Oligosphaeraceae bacterium]|nr:hypothetical protein [Oligosphaeraceae bacterium]